MGIHPTTSRRRPLVALLGVLAAAAAFAPAAGAAVTSTNITTNTFKTWDVEDGTDTRSLPINDRVLSGTVDAGASAGDFVTLGCFDTVSGERLEVIENAQVDAAKKWTSNPNIATIAGRYCRIAAVPFGTTSVTAADLNSKYKGSKVVSIGYWARSYKGLGGAPGNVFTYDYRFEMPTKSGYTQTYSIGSCGLCSMKTRKADGSTGPYLWGWNSSNYDGYSAYPTAPTTGSNADPLMLVDGKLAIDAYMVHNRTSATYDSLRFGPAGGITTSYSINQTNGDVTINESQPLYRCLDEADPASWKRCTKVAQTGVRLNRVITITSDGAIWRTADTYASADGKAHTVRATYVNYGYGSSSQGYRYGITGAYAVPVKGDKTGNALGSVGKTYAVIGSRYDTTEPTIDADRPLGDIVMTPRPALARVTDDTKYLYLRWSLPVAAKGKSATVKQAFTVAASDVNLVKLRNTAIAGLAK